VTVLLLQWKAFTRTNGSASSNLELYQTV